MHIDPEQRHKQVNLPCHQQLQQVPGLLGYPMVTQIVS